MMPSNFELRFYLHCHVKETVLTVAWVAGRILHETAFVLAESIPPTNGNAWYAAG